MTIGSPPTELPTMLDIDGRIGAILGASHELDAYRQWLAEPERAPGAPRDYLFTREVPRFEPRRGDVPLPADGLRIERRGAVAFATCPPARAEIELAGITAADAKRLLAAMDGNRCLLEVQWHAAVEPSVLSRLLRATFGRVIFAPAAASELEEKLPGVQLCRFPSSPYGIDRCYWENMVAVRERFRAGADRALAATDLLLLLRELHVVALLGRRLDSFYKPASPGADRGVPPGALLLDSPTLRPGVDCAIFLSGPRVNASFVGGAGYHRAVARSVDDEPALAEERTIELDRLNWGSVTRARGERDDAPAAWFCPPRPMVPDHFEWLADALAAARAAASAVSSRAASASTPAPASPELVNALGRWHWGFVRLHPFHCANQSLAMNLANSLLDQSHGAGIPHLLLDQLALRLSLAGYLKVFSRAVSHWAIREVEPGPRLRRLLALRASLFALLESTSAVGAELDVTRLVEQNSAAACAALLSD